MGSKVSQAMKWDSHMQRDGSVFGDGLNSPQHSQSTHRLSAILDPEMFEKAQGQLPPRTIGLKSVVSICIAAMTGSCLVLPAGAVDLTGGSVWLAILISGLAVAPHCVCVAELSTAMPRSGGDFVYLSQAFGPLFGSMCGIGVFSSLTLKGSFGLVGFVYYLETLTGKLDAWIQKVIPLSILVFITILNLMGMKKLKAVQKNFTVGATVLLFALCLVALKDFDSDLNFTEDNFITNGEVGLLQAAAFVYMSYAGITKICSVGGEVKKPGRNLPRGMFISTFVMTLFFSLATFAMVGVIKIKYLKKDYAPFYSMAVETGGDILGGIVAVLCMLTMAGMANVAVAAVSRFPYAMATDGLIPSVFIKMTDAGAPWVCILLSSFLMGVAVVTLDVKKIAKLASVNYYCWLWTLLLST